MNIYLSNETNFNNNGLGFLTDIISATVTDELNGNYELNFEYAINGNLEEYLVSENIIKCKVADGTKQLFRITSTEKTFKTIKVSAKHIFYDLLNNFIADAYPQNKNGQTFLAYILSNTNYETNFQAISDITNLKSARYVRMNPVQVIMGDIDNSMVNLFGGELKRDNFDINFLSRVGEDNGVKLLIGKNITGINVSEDITNMATRVMPQGFDGLLLPELYVDSPLINNYPTPKITKIEFSDVKYDPEDENAYHTLDEAYAELRRLVNEQYSLGLDKPIININIDWVELSKTEEYKQYSNLETVRLGDTITAEILGLNYETRVIATTYNVLKDRIVNFQIGTFKPTIATQMSKIEKSVEDIDTTSILESAKNNATQLITSAMGGYVYKTNSELYIMDNPDPQLAQKVWRWNINGLGYSSTGINGTYGIAMTMDGSIVADFITTGTLNTNVIQGYGSLTLQVQDNTNAIGNRTGKTTTLTQDIDSIEAQISDIADITTSASADTAVIADTDLQNIAVSNPIRIEIHPIIDNISYLYPNTGLYPSATTYLKIRKIKFTNTTTSEFFEYTLPTDLLYYDSDNYDSLVADYESNLITITKKCKYKSDGTVELLTTPTTETMTYIGSGLDFALTEGNYRVELPSYSNGYLFVRLMVLNAYTAQYATKIELGSAISQTAEDINLSVDRKLTDYSTTTEMNAAIDVKAAEITSSVSETYATKTTTNQLSSRISQTAKNITLTVNNSSTSSGIVIGITKEDGTTSQATGTIQMNGLVSFTNLSTSGQTTINGGNITTGTIKSSNYVSGTSGTSINLSNGAIDSKNFKVSSSGNITATGGTIGGWTIQSGHLGTAISTPANTYFLSQSGQSAYMDNGGTRNWYLYFKNKFGIDTNGNVFATGMNLTSATFNGSITGGSININNYFSVNSSGGTQLSTSGGGFFTTRRSTHPYVSALNVAQGSGGIVFTTGSDQSGVGNAIASIELVDGVMRTRNYNYYNGYYTCRTGKMSFIGRGPGGDYEHYMAVVNGMIIYVGDNIGNYDELPWLV